MDDLGRRARAFFSTLSEDRIAHDVIENYHALGAGYPLQQALDLRVVDRLDLVGIVEIPNDSTWDGLWSG